MNHNYVGFDPNGADDEVRATQRDHMNEIKHTPGPWPIERDRNFITSIGPIVAEEYAGAAWLDVSEEDALVASAAPDMAMALEMLAAEADAGTVMIPSALRLTIDAALIKAGRKAAPTAVRHVTIAGGAK
ncbi:hypothetical protein [Burkholderia cenocepacia]|uniref:hypothetical protein n=1 Tax=Burkholderia cenocepacia TaxID=95486 RepID=UPI0009821AA4|nr:hypothetical protein [Burkholderia cenocepacia]ONR50477.1 hypothetical protein A8E17_33350 [Burkholderia cenocepacia]